MDKMISKRIRTCDICGWEITTDESGYFKDTEKRDWLHMDLSKCVYDEKIKMHHSIGHSVDLCPSCSKEIIKYLKENCDVHATWPEGL